MHANDKVYCLELAQRLMEQHCTERAAVEDHRALLEEAKREARAA